MSRTGSGDGCEGAGGWSDCGGVGVGVSEGVGFGGEQWLGESGAVVQLGAGAGGWLEDEAALKGVGGRAGCRARVWRWRGY